MWKYTALRPACYVVSCPPRARPAGWSLGTFSLVPRPHPLTRLGDIMRIYIYIYAYVDQLHVHVRCWKARPEISHHWTLLSSVDKPPKRRLVPATRYCVRVYYKRQWVHRALAEFPTSQNFYEGDVQVWRPDSRFPRYLGTKSRVCRSGTRANSMYMQNFSLGWWRLTFANLWFCGFSRKFFPREIWGRGILGASNPRDLSPRKSYFSSIRQVFSLQSFCCTVLPRLHNPVVDWISRKDRRLAQRLYSLARCGWLAILRGWAGEPCKIRVSPEKNGWVGRSALGHVHGVVLSMCMLHECVVSVAVVWRRDVISLKAPRDLRGLMLVPVGEDLWVLPSKWAIPFII